MSQRDPSKQGWSRRSMLRLSGALALAGCATNKDEEPANEQPEYDEPTDSGSTTLPTTTTMSTPSRTPMPLDPPEGAPETGPFPMGVASGYPTSDGLTLWTKGPASGSLSLRVWLWSEDSWVEQSELAAVADEAGFAAVDVTGLASDAIVAYQFVDGGAGSVVGIGRTALAAGSTDSVRFGACSCTDQDHEEMAALSAVQTVGDMDFFLWLGDTIYADGLRTLEEYRGLWEYQLSRPEFVGLQSRVPGIFTWDDHEVANNWNPQTLGADHKEAAFQSFFENLPFPEGVRTERKLWGSYRFGETAEVFVLDCRSERDFDNGIYISVAQMDWLKEALSESTAVWKVIVNSVPITNMPDAWRIADSHLDRWDGYPGTQRQEILDHIADGITGVLWVAGDLHQTGVSRPDKISDGTSGSAGMEVMVGPGGSFLNLAAWAIEDEDQFHFADADHSATWFELNHEGTARIVTINEEQEVMMDWVINTSGEIVSRDVTYHPWENL